MATVRAGRTGSPLRNSPPPVPRSRAAFTAAGEHLLGGVPMTWMRMWPGGFPVYQAAARGARRAQGIHREVASVEVVIAAVARIAIEIEIGPALAELLAAS